MRLNRFSFALSFRAPKQPFVFIPVANQLVALKLFRCCKNDGRRRRRRPRPLHNLPELALLPGPPFFYTRRHAASLK
jgi:hypothetical protein